MSNSLLPTSPSIRRASTRRRAGSNLPPLQDSHHGALQAIRTFLKGRICYDAFPISFRLIVLDTKLSVKRALQCLLMNSVVSAPLWNSDKSEFAGMLTVLDIIHLIQYYWRTRASYDFATEDSSIEIETELGVAQPPLLRKHPDNTLYEAAQVLVQTHARRLPLLDYDSDTGHEVIVSTLTQYRLLKFISINCHQEIQKLNLSLRRLKIGTYVAASLPTDVSEGQNPYHPIATATLNTTVFSVVHMFSELSISAVPIINEDGIVVNLYETVDVMTLVRSGSYQSLDLTISEALKQRSVDFPGVVICTASDSLGTLLQLIKKRRVHRLVVVEGEEEEKKGGRKGRLMGIITLSDVLRYIMGAGTIAEAHEPRQSQTQTPSISAPPSEGPSSPTVSTSPTILTVPPTA
ncbi:CBS-domain-containing protein [Lentinula aciculospora]|uniref:CBS-domain-containing protein n=1 Tax=Lentinula aciculospora TaxID=153920 RepID=A0A9W9AM90_9AGAR|nr:CBS-domain-containing protein [Lentinula aciculospora]